MTVSDRAPVDGVPVNPATAPRGLAANLSSLATSQAITWVATLAWTLVVPRLLGPEQMGVLVTGIATTAILGVVLGLPTRDFLAREMVADPSRAPGLLGTALVLRVALVPVFFVLTEVYAQLAGIASDARTVLHLCAGVTVCTLLAEPCLAAFQATERMENLARYEILSKTLQAVGGIVLVVAGLRVVGLAGFNLLVAAALVVPTVARVRRLVAVDWRTDLRRTWAVVRASAPYWTFGVFFMLYLWIDTVLLGLLAPAAVVGWYGVATKLFMTMMFVPVILGTAWLPRLVRAFERGPEVLAREARVPVETAFALSLPLCVATAVGAAQVVPLLYGDEYAGAAPALAVLALCFPPTFVNIMLFQTVIASGRPLAWMRLMALATVVNPPLNLLLIPLAEDRWANGAVGAAWSLFLTELLVLAGGVLIAGRRLLCRSTTSQMGRALLSALVMAAVMLALPGGVLVGAPLGLAVYAGCALALGVVSPAQLRDGVSALRASRRPTPTSSDAAGAP